MTIPSYDTVLEHGDWQRYKPSTRPEGAPANALYAQRGSDGADWYQYVNAGTHFQSDTLKMTVTNNIVSTATADPTMLFPGDGTILEITGTSLEDPHDAWSRKIYDPATQTFSDPPPPPAMSDFETRLAALEAKLKGA